MMRIVTRRLRIASAAILLMLPAGACGSGGRAEPVPAPPPAPSATRPAPVVADNVWRGIDACVVDAEGVREIPAQYNLRTGDTLVDGRPFHEVFPATERYAESAGWYVNNEPLPMGRIQYVKYGLPRVLRPEEIFRIGEYHGVPLFAERADPGVPYGVVYAAVRPACEFQSYQWDLITGGVRG